MLDHLELERVEKNVREAETEDLLNRVTVYRDGMEPAALDIIENELCRRGISWQKVENHGEQLRQETLVDADGFALQCSFCHRPAIMEGWGIHWLWGRLPFFPRWFHYCREHSGVSPTS